MPSIHLLPGGRIHDGARLRVSYYHGTTIYADDDPEVPLLSIFGQGSRDMEAAVSAD